MATNIDVLYVTGVSMNQTEYVKNYIENYLNNSENHIIFITDQSNSFGNSVKEYDFLRSLYGETYTYHWFDGTKVEEPFAPFVQVLKSMYTAFYADSMTVEQFAEASGVYSLHTQLISTYLKLGRAERGEAMIVSEAGFEKERMTQSIISAIKYVFADRPGLIILDGICNCGISTLRIISRLNSILKDTRLKIIAVYNDDIAPRRYCHELFEKIIREADENGRRIDFYDYDTVQSYEDYVLSIDRKIPLDKKLMSEYIIKLSNLFYFLNYEDMEYYVSYFYKKIIDEGIRLTIGDAYEFYSFATRCYMIAGDYNRATIMSERLSRLYDRKREPMKDFGYNYVCEQLHVLMGQTELATKYALECMDIAKKMGDEFLMFYGVVLYYEAINNGWNDMFNVAFNKVATDEEFISELKRHKYYNTLAHYLVFSCGSDKDTIRRIAHGYEVERYDEAMALIELIGNKDLEISVYTKYIVLMNNYGMHKEVEAFYERKLEVLESVDNPRREANTYLGRGYGKILSEQFEYAEADLINAVHILFRLEDAEAVCEALYNIAINRSCAQDYVSVSFIMRQLMKLLEVLGMNTLKICDRVKLLGISAIAALLTGDEYNCYSLTKRVRALVDMDYETNNHNVTISHNYEENLYIYELLSALLAAKSGDGDMALRHFEIAHTLFEKVANVEFFTAFLLYSEYYLQLRKSGDDVKAGEIMVEAAAYCERYDKPITYNLIKNCIEGKQIDPLLSEPPFTEYAIRKINRLAKDVGKDRIIAKQKKGIWFLSSWQELLNHDLLDKDIVLEDAFNSFQDGFNIDRMLYVSISGDWCSVEYANYKVHTGSLSIIPSFFNKFKSEFVSNCMDNDYTLYSSMLEVLNTEVAYTIIGIPVFSDKELIGAFVGSVGENILNVYSVNEDDLAIMKTAIVQVHNTIERLEAKLSILNTNKRLGEMVGTDFLTGLYNRQGMEEAIDEIDGLRCSVSVMYIDLDNFKYYNDHFGHEVGDMILKGFAKILREVTNSAIGDRAVRYGGDEFVILLPGDTGERARSMAQIILKKMKTGLIKQITEYADEDVVIPDDKKLSGSVGIAIADDGKREHLAEALSRADEALYEVKRNGKSGYFVI